MAKIKTSISIDVRALDNLKSLAVKFFNGNISKVIEWFGMSKQERIVFLKFMAKHHAQQLNAYQQLYRDAEEANQEKNL